MRPENFIYFFTVCGFFVGLSFSVLTFLQPSDVLLYTAEITLFFYLFVHLVIAYFVDSSNLKNIVFQKRVYEKNIDEFVYEVENREKVIDALITEIEKEAGEERKLNTKRVKRAHVRQK